MSYDNTDRGVLFRDREKASDKHPDYTGKIDVGGHEYRLVAWLNTSKTGIKFMSLRVSEFKSEEAAPVTGGPEFSDEDIPF